MTQWSIGCAERGRLTIELLSLPVKDEGYDWVSALATVDVGGFHGSANLMLTLADMVHFHQQLQTLHKTLKGEAEFTTIEGQVYLKLTTDGLGNITVSGHLLDQAGIGNRLTYSLALDQTFLGQTMTDLETAIKTAKG